MIKLFFRKPHGDCLFVTQAYNSLPGKLKKKVYKKYKTCIHNDDHNLRSYQNCWTFVVNGTEHNFYFCTRKSQFLDDIYLTNNSKVYDYIREHILKRSGIL